MKKSLPVLLCCLIFTTMGVAQSVDLYEGSDICLSAARSQEASDDLIVQCLERASLDTLAKMQKRISPLWELGNYVLGHPYLKSCYDDRIAVLCQNPSLETQAFIIDSLLINYIPHHSTCNFDQSVMQTIKNLSFDDVVGLYSFYYDENLRPNRTASTVYKYAIDHSELEVHYSHRIFDILKDLSLEQWTKLPLSYVVPAFSVEDLLPPLIQNLTLTELLSLNRKNSPLRALGEYIRDFPYTKPLHDKRLAQVSPTLSFENWKEIPSCLSDFHSDLISNPILKAAYDEGVMNLVPGLSFEQMKEFHRWANEGGWYLSPRLLDIRKAYGQHMTTVLQNLSLEELASVKGLRNLEMYMDDEAGYYYYRSDPSLKPVKEVLHDALVRALNQSSYEEVSLAHDMTEVVST